MLFLSRRKDERIIIGTGPTAIEIVYCGKGSSSGSIKLGIKAPANVPIDRMEIRVAKEAAAERAKGGTP